MGAILSSQANLSRGRPLFCVRRSFGHRVFCAALLPDNGPLLLPITAPPHDILAGVFLADNLFSLGPLTTHTQPYAS